MSHHHHMRRWMRLFESITDDPETNAEIERRLIDLDIPHNIMPPALILDALEFIKDAGVGGLTAEALTAQLSQLYPDLDLTPVMDVIPQAFDNVVRAEGGSLVWNQSEEAEEPPPPEMTQAVDMAYTGLELMRELTRQKGSFSENDLAAKLSQRLHIPSSTGVEFANHLIGQFRSMLNSGGGSYAMRDEEPTSREQNMDFLRGLANRPSPEAE